MSAVTLQDVATAREAARVRVAAAESALKALEPEMNAARAELGSAREELARIELALRSAQRAHLIAVAVDALDVETSEPPLIVVQQRLGLPDVYELAALDAGGRGLYLHKAERMGRGGGKAYALRREHVPAEVLEVLAEREALRGGMTSRNAELIALRDRLETLTSPGAVYEVKHVHGSEELTVWQAHGKGQFGYDGAMRPLPPPTGEGRWRWLKVAEQQHELGA